MGRVLSIFLPQWEIELCQRRSQRGKPDGRARRDDGALLLMVEVARQQIVARCCRGAQAAGVHLGMPVAEARALFPQARVAAFDPGQSVAALGKLAEWALRFSPLVMVDPVPLPRGGRSHLQLPATPDGLLLEITGAAHLFGGEALLLHEIVARLAWHGVTARAAAAPTIGAAWALTRYGRHPLAMVQAEQLATALAPLPIQALRLPAPAGGLSVEATLLQVGVERIGQLLALPRESLAARFGTELLLRVDQAFDRVAELIVPVRPQQVLAANRDFEAPLTAQDTIMLAVQELLEALCRELLVRESGLRELEVELRYSESRPRVERIVLGRASRNVKHLWMLVRPKLEASLVPETTRELSETNLTIGVEGITLRAPWVVRMRHEQASALEEAEGGGGVAEFLDTVVNRLGMGRVLRMEAVASHIPERAVRFAAAVGEGGTAGTIQLAKKVEEEGASMFRGGLDMAHRPSTLLEMPEPAEAMALVPDGPPKWLRWRGREYALIAGVGPERIAPEWWRETPSARRKTADGFAGGGGGTRDYFKVQTAEGVWLWVFRTLEGGRWFVQGMWM